MNWTSLGNVTTVTKTGLTLSVGQTYYFSVKAVNGAGLTGSATNSNGQTVVDTTPPSAPANVRDGTGADISTTSSTTQLSANWDAATDAESGISGYQYAIGTTAGGTQTVNWTSLGNVTTVTKTGLTLTVGQTYYFSVQAVNGAGLTGSATNSNGQTVVSSATTYFSDNFENWTVHGGAWSSVSGETSTHTLNTSTDYARAGTKSLKLTDNDTTTSYGACLVKNFSPTIASGIYVRFYVYLPSAYISANNGAASRRLLRVFCGNNRGQMSLYLGGRPMMEEVGAWGRFYRRRRRFPRTRGIASRCTWRRRRRARPCSTGSTARAPARSMAVSAAAPPITASSSAMSPSAAAPMPWARSTWTKLSSPIPTMDRFRNRRQSLGAALRRPGRIGLRLDKTNRYGTATRLMPFLCSWMARLAHSSVDAAFSGKNRRSRGRRTALARACYCAKSEWFTQNGY